MFFPENVYVLKALVLEKTERLERRDVFAWLRIEVEHHLPSLDRVFVLKQLEQHPFVDLEVEEDVFGFNLFVTVFFLVEELVEPTEKVRVAVSDFCHQEEEFLALLHEIANKGLKF